jgi:hypothetical protein
MAPRNAATRKPSKKKKPPTPTGNKIRIQVTPTEQLLALETLAYSFEDETLPDAWTEVGQLAAAANDVALECSEKLEGYAEFIGKVLAFQETMCASSDGSDHVEVDLDVDLRDLQDDEDGLVGAQLFLLLLEAMDGAVEHGFEAIVHVGGRLASLDQAEALLRAKTSSWGWDIDDFSDWEDEDEGEEEDDTWDDDWEEDDAPGWEVDGDETQGGFGGLGDDHLRGGSSDGLTEAARFFLQATGATWPMAKEVLNQHRKRVLREAHPDRHPNNENAHHRFVLLNQGADDLAKLAK